VNYKTALILNARIKMQFQSQLRTVSSGLIDVLPTVCKEDRFPFTFVTAVIYQAYILINLVLP